MQKARRAGVACQIFDLILAGLHQMLDSFAVWVVALLEILLMVDIQELDHVEILVVLLGLIIRGTNLQVHHGLFNGHGSEAKVWIRLASGVPMTLPDFCIWLQLHYFFESNWCRKGTLQSHASSCIIT